MGNISLKWPHAKPRITPYDKVKNCEDIIK